ncbi:Colicin-A [Serratia entomophila]|nr:hypothetical protein [Serratia entomophila]UIW18818.1 hypothetical protein KHA73_02330 [Serratia entomophila]CAI0801504.1 Colicin-A [Serratia entomophila]CAI0817110.1 Colicin-A [Serratia entomophila]CAI0838820.1 Colicin-A [Serratia entomophila]CAI0856365.1 Colicin-A [Serratia entomophila]
MFFNVNARFSLQSPDGEENMTVSGDRDRPGPTESTGNNGGDRDNSGSSTGVETLNVGDSYMTPFGPVVIDRNGHPTMNGIVMTAENTSFVD